MIPEERSAAYVFGRRVGFTVGFAVFFSMFFLILSLQKKVPEGIEYIHFLGVGILLSIIVIILRGRGVERRRIVD